MYRCQDSNDRKLYNSSNITEHIIIGSLDCGNDNGENINTHLQYSSFPTLVDV